MYIRKSSFKCLSELLSSEEIGICGCVRNKYEKGKKRLRDREREKGERKRKKERMREKREGERERIGEGKKYTIIVL